MRGGGDRFEVSTTHINPEGGRIGSLKKSLHRWREFVILAQRVFHWNKHYYAYIIAGCVSLFFLCWWWLDVSVLTTFAATLFVVATADYALPNIGPKLIGDKPWGELEDSEFNIFCQQVVDVQDRVSSAWHSMLNKKATHPKTYMASVTGVLFLLGLLGSAVNNTLLMYFFVLGLSLVPGAQHHGLIKLYYGKMCQQLQILLKRGKPKTQ